MKVEGLALGRLQEIFGDKELEAYVDPQAGELQIVSDRFTGRAGVGRDLMALELVGEIQTFGANIVRAWRRDECEDKQG